MIENDDFIKIVREAMRRNPDRVIVNNEDFHNQQIEIINNQIKKAKTINKIKDF